MKNILITGGAKGIGAGMVDIFAENGYNIAVHYNTSAEQAEKLITKHKNKDIKIKSYCCDLRNSNQVSKMIDDVINDFGSIDILINNAGISQIKLFTDISETEWDNMFDCNIKSMFNCCKKILPSMINNKKGSIINISSIWGITGASCEVHYSASKGAVIAFTKALAQEVAPSGIAVNCIAPGVIESDMLNGFSGEDIKAIKDETPTGLIGKPEDVARIALFLAEQSSNFLTGQVISPNGGLVV